MASSIQRRRGTTSDHATFTGAVGEITIDTTKDTVVVHDGAVVGGVPLLREDGSNSSLALGSQGVPSLKFSGDPNTGIYSPGADQLAVATNGTGRLFIDATGNVGVGPIQSPSWASASSTVLSIVDSAFANVAALRVEGPTTVTEVGAGPSFTWAGSFSNHSYILYTNTIERARIRADGTFEIKGAGTAGTSPGFSVSPSTPANSFVIDSSGRLGIGTSDVRGTLGLQHGNTSPQGLNDVAIDALRISQSVGGIVAIRTTQYDAANQPAAGDTQFFNLYFNGSTYNYYERMRIRADGCVGIGTTPASGTTLHVDATGGATVRVSRISASAGAYGQLEHDGTNTTLTSTAATAFVNNGTEKARIRSDGMFEVKGAGVSGSSPAFSVNGSAPANSAIIDTSGRLLVGTSTSNPTFESRVQVAGSGGGATILIDAYSANTNSPVLYFGKSRNATVGTHTIVQNNDSLGAIDFYGSDNSGPVNAATIACLVDATATINAGSFVASRRYKIATVGTTDFTAIGASANTVGVIFTATGVGAGTGTATSEPYANSMPGRLVFSTTADGGSSPTERMRITSGGLVGIGTISPNSKLGVIDSSTGLAATIRNENATNGYGLAIETEGTSSTRYALILRNLASDVYYGGVSTATGQVGYWGIGVSPTGTLGNRLTVGGSASIGSGSYLTTAAPANGLIVQGNVGIGTSGPNYQLHVTTSFAVGAAGFNQQLSFTNDTIQSLLLGTGYTPLKLNPSGGSVGIGTSSPEGKLTVAGTGAEPPSSGTTANSLLQLKDATLNNELNMGLHTVTGNYGAYIQASDNNLAVPYGLHLQPKGGYVGIGTTSPNTSLNVAGVPHAEFGSALLFDTTSTAVDVGGVLALGGYKTAQTNQSVFGSIKGGKENATSANESGYLKFSTNNNLTLGEKARIDSSGRLLVGTTSNANGGQVEAKTAVVVSGNPAYDKKAFIAQIPYATANITSSLLSGFDGNIHGVDLGYRYNSTGYDLCFATNSTTSGSPTERMRIKSDGDVTITNGSVNAKSFISNNQNAELLGYAYASNGAFIDLTNITASNFTILEIFGSVNPNAAGSSYIDPIHMYVYHGYGWNGSQLTSYIYSRHVAPIRTSDIFPSGGTGGNVCDAVWYNGSVESDSCIAGSGSHNVRLKITNWATSVGSSFNVRVFKRF